MKGRREQGTKPPQRESDYRISADGFVARAEPASPWSCPVCHDKGFRWAETEKGYPALAPCSCARIARVIINCTDATDRPVASIVRPSASSTCETDKMVPSGS